MLDVDRLRVLAAVSRTGSVTAAARELHYSQPSISHHMARLEVETGATLTQRVGRGIRLTDAGRILAERAQEILGRLDAAEHELAAHVGLRAGKVRVATFASAMLVLIPRVVELLAAEHPGLELDLTDTHPPEAMQMLRAGAVDIALTYRYDDDEEPGGVRQVPLFTDPTCLITPAGDPGRAVVDHRDSGWITGCQRVREGLLAACAREGFVPRVTASTDDIAAIQTLVASGLGVALIPQLALRAHQVAGVDVHTVPGSARHVVAATFGEPPDPPPTRAVLAALQHVSSTVTLAPAVVTR